MKKPRILLLSVLCFVCSSDLSAFERSDWPRWSGPTDRFIATNKGLELIDDFRDAREVWRSEAIPTAHGNYSSRNLEHLPSSGGCSPILYDGKVIFNYYAPSPGSKTGENMNYRVSKQPAWAKKILADDIFMAFDMSTGRTVWKRVFSEKGLNIQDMKSPGRIHYTPVAHNGRIFAVGTSYRLYCLNAENGEPVWEKTIPGYFEESEAIKDDALATSTIVTASGDGGGRRNGHNLNFVADYNLLIVTVNDDIFAFDMATGEIAWSIVASEYRPLLGSHANPVEWRGSDGRVYLLCTGNGLTCLDAETGEVKWHLDGCLHDVNAYVEDDIAVFGYNMLKNHEYWGNDVQFLNGYRLDPISPELLWTHTDSALVHKVHYQGIASGGYLYYPLFLRGDKNANPQNDENRNDSSVCVSMKTGERIGAVDVGAWAQSIYMMAEERIFHCIDFSHNEQQLFFLHPAPDFRMMGGVFEPAHTQTTAKHNAALMSPYADGYMYLRTGTSIHCYDLRKNPLSVSITSPDHNAELQSDNLTVSCHTSFGENGIVASALYVDGVRVDEKTGAVETWILTDLVPGPHEIRVDVQDGKTVSSDWIMVSIGEDAPTITEFPFLLDLGSKDDASNGPPMSGFLPDRIWTPGSSYGFVENVGRFSSERVHYQEGDKPYVWHSWGRTGDPLRYRIRLDAGNYYWGFGFMREDNQSVRINGTNPSLIDKTWKMNPVITPAEGDGRPDMDFPLKVTSEAIEVPQGLTEMEIAFSEPGLLSMNNCATSIIISKEPIGDLQVSSQFRGWKKQSLQQPRILPQPGGLLVSNVSGPTIVRVFNASGRQITHKQIGSNRTHVVVETPGKGVYLITVETATGITLRQFSILR